MRVTIPRFGLGPPTDGDENRCKSYLNRMFMRVRLLQTRERYKIIANLLRVFWETDESETVDNNR